MKNIKWAKINPIPKSQEDELTPEPPCQIGLKNAPPDNVSSKYVRGMTLELSGENGRTESGHIKNFLCLDVMKWCF